MAVSQRAQAIFLISGLFVAGVGQAATFAVNSRVDEVDASPGNGICASASSVCTLRAAVMEANATAGADVITLPGDSSPTPAAYFLSLRRAVVNQLQGETNAAEGDVDITESLTIRGDTANPASVVIDGGYDATYGPGVRDRLFQVSPPATGTGSSGTIDVIIEGVKLSGGYQPEENFGGGAILVYAPQQFGSATGPIPRLTLRNAILEHNYAWVTGGCVTSHGGETLIEDTTLRDCRTPYIPNIGLTTGGQGGFPGGAFIGGGQGGGIALWQGNVTLRRSVISGGYAQVGGGVYAQDASGVPSLFLAEDSVIQSNFAFMGAGIFNSAFGQWDFGAGTLRTAGVILNRVTMNNNSAEFAGGGIFNIATLTLNNSTVALNRAWDDPGNPIYPNKGGGIYNSGRVLEIRSSTVAGNEAEEFKAPTQTTANDAAGGDEIFFDHINSTTSASTLRFAFNIQNSIIGDGPNPNPGDPNANQDDNCNGPNGFSQHITSLGNNLDSGATCFQPAAAPLALAVARAVATTSDLPGKGNVLQPLADNGALSSPPVKLQTRALIAGSPAIGAAAAAACPSSDGRGFVRQGTTCDIGAFQTNVNKTLTAVPNSAPTARDDRVSINGSVGQTATVDVLANDGDADPTDTVTIDQTVPPTASLGNVTVTSGFGPTTRQKVQYTLNTAPANATTDTVTYTITDGTARATGKLVVNIYPQGSNNLPVAKDDTINVNQGQTALLVLTNDTDADAGDVLAVNSVSGVTPPNAGKLEVSQNDPTKVVFTPTAADTRTGTAAYFGAYQFTYTVRDNRGGISATSGVVSGMVNATPVITKSPQALTVAPGATVSDSISATDPDADAKQYEVSANGALGTAAIDPTSGAFEYTARLTASGQDKFTVTVSDSKGASSSVTVTVNITGTPVSNAAPDVTSPIAVTVAAGATASGSISATDPEKKALRFYVTAQGSKGTASINTDTGAFEYAAAADSSGSDQLLVTVDDLASTKEVTVNVTIGAVTTNPGTGANNPGTGTTNPGSGNTSPGTGNGSPSTGNPGSNPGGATKASPSGGGAIDIILLTIASLLLISRALLRPGVRL